MGQEKEVKRDKGEGPKLLPNIVVELTTIVSSRHPQTGDPQGPMAQIALMGRRCKQMMELIGDGPLPDKFLGVKVLEEFADRVLADFEETWGVLDAIDAGKLTAVPEKALADSPEPEEGEGNDDHPDGDGTDEAEAPTRGTDPEKGDQP